MLALDATDGALAGAAQTTVVVVAHNDAPLVSAGSDQALAYPNRTTTLLGVATDDGHPTGGTLNTTWSVVSAPGSVTFANPSAATTSVTFGYPGTYVLRLTATDGELSAASDVTIVVEAPPGAVPVVALTAPADGATVTAPTTISGRVSAGEWRLESRLGGEDGDGPWVLLASGSQEVAWSNLARFDPTMLLNGVYAIRLLSTTAGGSAETTIHVSVEKNLKVGNFTVSFNDLTVPVAGLPIEVIRSYDSRDKAVGDFGVGWNVSLRNIRVETSGMPGKGWHQQQQPGFWPVYCVTAARPRFVTVLGRDYRNRTA